MAEQVSQPATQKGQTSVTTVREATSFSDIPPATHKLVDILQFGTSYELVEWLAHKLREVSERMTREHQDNIMIQKSLSGAVEPEEQQEVERIGRQRNAKNKGEAIQMPPLHEALVEVHREYERASKAAKDMADLYKKETVALEVLNKKYTRTQVEKEELSKQCRQIEEKLRKAEEELLTHQQPNRLSDFEQELKQRLKEAEASTQSATTRAEEADARAKKIEERLLSAKTEVGKWLDAKDAEIRRLKR